VRTLILGVGNTIMGDDGVGIYVARMVKDRVRSRAGFEIKELSVGGLKLVEEILGYEEVIIVDSYASHDTSVGRIREFTPEEFKGTLHASSPHDTNFATALELYRGLEPTRIPRRIRIFTIDIHPTSTFREGLSRAVQEAASKLAESIIHETERVF
jgi:hydrogenase maturation protease